MLFQKGKHPLRKYELRLGMILHAKQTQPNRDNKPIPNALDACKPFIEDGPGASVVFIHSTVPHYAFINHCYLLTAILTTREIPPFQSQRLIQQHAGIQL